MVASGGPLGKYKWSKTVLKESIAAAKVATQHTIKGRLKAAQLPTTGKVRFVPPKGYKPENPLPNKKGIFEDKFGNKWQKGPSRTEGQPFEWDVQLSSKGKAQLGWASSSGSHINVSLDGKITH
jgi:filamentous hemagglutinin